MVLQAADISSVYLEAYTMERVCIQAGPEFGNLEGHLLVVVKALYGLWISGKMFIELLAGCLIYLVFEHLRAEDNIFLEKSADGKTYGYMAAYCHDLCIVSKDLKAILYQLKSDLWKFKFKRFGAINGNGNGTFCVNPRKYIKCMEET